MLSSALFAGDPLLEAIAADGDRISRTRHQDDPAVLKVQRALLIWDPECLPLHGADGTYGDETAQAVARFKVEVIGVPPPSVVDDVGPQTVLRLDAIAAEHEPPAEPGAVDPQLADAVRTILGDSASASVAALAAELARQGLVTTPAQVAATLRRLLDA